MPFVDRSMQRGVLVRWFKAEGDFVAYGEDVCEVAVDERLVLKKRKDARTLAGGTPDATGKRFAIGEGHRLRSRKHLTDRLRLTSSDTGILRRILVREQGQLVVGDLLAVLTTTADEPVDDGQSYSFRVVANRIEPAGGPWLSDG